MNNDLATILKQSKFVRSAKVVGNQIFVVCECGEEVITANSTLAMVFVRDHDALHNKVKLEPRPILIPKPKPKTKKNPETKPKPKPFQP